MFTSACDCGKVRHTFYIYLQIHLCFRTNQFCSSGDLRETVKSESPRWTSIRNKKGEKGEGRALSELVVASCCRGSDGVGMGRQGDRQVSGPLHFLMYASWMTSFSSLHPVDLSAFLGPK